PRHDLNEGPEVRYALNSSKIRLVDLRHSGDLLNCALGGLSLLEISRSDIDSPGVLDINLAAGFFHQSAYHLAARPDHFANLVDRYLNGEDSRRVLANLRSRRRKNRVHLFQDVEPAVARLLKRIRQYLCVYPCNLDVHL